jgi:hypothetical protein
METHQKRIFILGAGSSKGHSEGLCPSINEFFSVAKRLNIDLDSYSALAEYTKTKFAKSITDRRNKIDIELLFTNIEIDIERRSSFDLLELRQKLLKLIQTVLIEVEKHIIGHKGEYDDFVLNLKPNDTLINFNWDLLLDNKLGRLIALNDIKSSKVKADVHPQYNNFIKNLSAYSEWTWAHASIQEPYVVWPANFGYLLKMHGSIDWFYCPNDRCRACHKVFPLLYSENTFRCSECHEELDSLLIPPILNKGYRQYPLIRRVWNLAAQEIQSATELIIWGYSLPPTDFYSDWLLRQARVAPITKLAIINPEVIDKNKKRVGPIVKRFRDIYRREGTHPETLLYEYYGDFLAGNDTSKKYGIGIPLPVTRIDIT